jgi:hypothetical protein
MRCRTGCRAVLLSRGCADLRSEWNWNVMQLFVWIEASFTTKEHVRAPAASRLRPRAD